MSRNLYTHKLDLGFINSVDLKGIEFVNRKEKELVFANMMFIGQLVLRSLPVAKIIIPVIQDLTNYEQAEAAPKRQKLHAMQMRLSPRLRLTALPPSCSRGASRLLGTRALHPHWFTSRTESEAIKYVQQEKQLQILVNMKLIGQLFL